MTKKKKKIPALTGGEGAWGEEREEEKRRGGARRPNRACERLGKHGDHGPAWVHSH